GGRDRQLSTSAQVASNFSMAKRKESSAPVVDVEGVQIAEFRDAFALFDQDGDGFISRSELGHVMKTFGYRVSEQQLDAMLQFVDSDGDGLIDFPEFMTVICRNMASGRCMDDLRRAFAIFDRDSSGRVGPQELSEFMSSLGLTGGYGEAQGIIRDCDTDGDGEIDFQEFLRILAGNFMPPEVLAASVRPAAVDANADKASQKK
ncbi:hypothetical protein BOX15_Mlig007720g2, partial [Macrostomum lignano]